MNAYVGRVLPPITFLASQLLSQTNEVIWSYIVLGRSQTIQLALNARQFIPRHDIAGNSACQ